MKKIICFLFTIMLSSCHTENISVEMADVKEPEIVVVQDKIAGFTLTRTVIRMPKNPKPKYPTI